MSYTNQTVDWIHYTRGGGAQIDYTMSRTITVGAMGNLYGDVTTTEVKKIKARKQPINKFTGGDHGYTYEVKSYYYVDPSIEPNASFIQLMDTLDGEIVEDIYKMNDLSGRTKMIRFTTK